MHQMGKKKILIVLPYSGRGVSGGLAVFNQQITTTLAEFCDVKLLTMDLPDEFKAKKEEHKGAEIIYVTNEKKNDITSPASGGKDGEDQRNLLYQLLREAAATVSRPGDLGLPEGWTPDIIIGHSRFSGPATFALKRFFPDAKIVYFLHSVPIDATILGGDAKTEERKLLEEMDNMPKADLVIGVGPLLREAAQRLAQEAVKETSDRGPRIYEFMPGLEVGKVIEPAKEKNKLNLLLLGRADAGVKGLADAVGAIQILRAEYQQKKSPLQVHLKIRGISDQSVTVRGQKADLPSLGQEWADFMQDIIKGENQAKQPRAEEGTGSAQQPVRQPGSSELPSWIEVLPTTSDSEIKNADIYASNAVLMASHFEHFGLVWLEAASFGIPVLVNEYSGGAFFLSDENRMQDYGKPSVVHDGGQAAMRPSLWAEAIKRLDQEYEIRVAAAKAIRSQLALYTWPDAANALLEAVSRPEQYLVQGPKGTVQVHSGKLPDRDL